MTDSDVVDFLEHYGVKGMKWGVRKDRSDSIRTARKEMRSFSKNARSIIKQHRKSSSPKERKAAQERYQKEVKEQISSKAFRESYMKANTMGRGEMAVYVLLYGPFSAMTIPATKNQYAQNRQFGLGREQADVREFLKEMRSIK